MTITEHSRGVRVVFLPQGSRGCASSSDSEIPRLVPSLWKQAVNLPLMFCSSGTLRLSGAASVRKRGGNIGINILQALILGRSCRGRGLLLLAAPGWILAPHRHLLSFPPSSSCGRAAEQREEGACEAGDAVPREKLLFGYFQRDPADPQTPLLAAALRPVIFPPAPV